MKLNDLNPLFVDLDGVMADFDKRIIELTGRPASVQGQTFWHKIADLVISPGSERGVVLKRASKNAANSVDDLGFIKGKGSKVVGIMVKEGLLDKFDIPGIGIRYTLTKRGELAYHEVAAGQTFKGGPDFYNSLEKMPDADQLWSVAKTMNPVILTGKPMGNWAEGQKRAWVARELGSNVPVIVCMAREKAAKAAEYMGTPTLNGAILIDDREKARAPWEALGGRFILHTSASNSIALLHGLE